MTSSEFNASVNRELRLLAVQGELRALEQSLKDDIREATAEVESLERKLAMARNHVINLTERLERTWSIQQGVA